VETDGLLLNKLIGYGMSYWKTDNWRTINQNTLREYFEPSLLLVHDKQKGMNSATG
jgi:hypothetical protein